MRKSTDLLDRIFDPLNQKFLTKYPTIDYIVGDFLRDLTFIDMFKGKKVWRIQKNLYSILAGIYVAIPIHEILHGVAGRLLGYENQKIVINSMDGGYIWEKIIPWVTSEHLPFWKGGYVEVKGAQATLSENLLFSLAPYIMTPIGIYLLLEGKRKKCLPMVIAGCGFVEGHAESVFGDMAISAGNIMVAAADYLYKTVGYQMNLDEQGVKYILAVPAAVIAFGLWRYSYHFFRKGINYCREKVHGIDFTLTCK